MTKDKRPYRLQKRAASAEDTRRRIVAATGALLSAPGTRDVSLDDIAAEAGVSRQTIYVQFGSKRGVIEALHAQLAQGGLAPLLAELARGGDPVATLHRAFPLEFAFYDGSAVLLRAIYAQAAQDPDLGAMLQRGQAARWANIHRVLQQVAAAGRLAPGWTPESAADWLAATLGFPAYDELVHQRGWALDQLSARALELLDALLIRPAPGA